MGFTSRTLTRLAAATGAEFRHRAERCLNTRISLWPAGGVLTLQQNLHLMEHLWPSAPFYNYPRLYRRLRLTLVDKGSRIEGWWVGRFARDRTEG